MGRKSRLKRARRELKKANLSNGTSDTLFSFGEHDQSVYRFFKREREADALVRGEVWLSTLETCRKYEDPERGDPQEGYETYNSGHIVGGSDVPNFIEIAQRSGINFGSAKVVNCTLSNNTVITSLPDAYVLCTTVEFSKERLSETFGRYCVEITDIKDFFALVSECLGKSTQIIEAAAGKVIYKDRFYTGMAPPPGPIGFVKPPDVYPSQKEFRFLWRPKNTQGLTPFLLKCPEVSYLCKRIA